MRLALVIVRILQLYAAGETEAIDQNEVVENMNMMRKKLQSHYICRFTSQLVSIISKIDKLSPNPIFSFEFQLTRVFVQLYIYWK